MFGLRSGGLSWIFKGTCIAGFLTKRPLAASSKWLHATEIPNRSWHCFGDRNFWHSIQDFNSTLRFCVQGVWFNRQLLVGKFNFGSLHHVSTWLGSNFPLPLNVENAGAFVGCLCSRRFWYSQPETFKVDFGQLWGSLSSCSRLVTNSRCWEIFGNWWFAVPVKAWETRFYGEDTRNFSDHFEKSFWLTIPLGWHALGYATTSFLSSLSGGLYASPDPEPLLIFCLELRATKRF